jgi:hypothetical protein
MNLIDGKIDQLIRADLEKRPEQLRQFFERVQSNYDEAIRTASHFLLLLMAAWFLSFAIHMEWTSKIHLLGFEFKGEMLVASPFLIGLLTYGQLSALAGAVILWEAISRAVCHLLPKAWELRLDDLLAPPTFSNVERMLEPPSAAKLQSFFSRAWFVLVGGAIFLGSLVALAQTTYFLISRRHDSFAFLHPLLYSVLCALSVTLGLIAWFRGFVLFKSAADATGGVAFRHHRDSRGVEGILDQSPRDDCRNKPKETFDVQD